MAEIASRTNSHCQPANPRTPFISSSAAEIGEPSAVEMGAAAMNSAVTPARWRAGNQ